MRIYFLISLLSAGFLMGTSAYAETYKCQIDGTTVYQDGPCANAPKAAPLQLKVSAPSGPVPEKLPAQKAPDAPKPPVEVIKPAPELPTPPKLSQLDREAELCLQYVRETLHDPKSAYYTNPSKESRKLSMTVHAKNKLGGIVASQAECEINGGVLDKSWTNIHMKRLGWNERADQLGEKIQ